MGALSDLIKTKNTGATTVKSTGLKGLLEQSKKKPVKPTQPIQPALPAPVTEYKKATLPRDLGGGSYYIQPGEPNKLIKPEATKTYGSLQPKTGQQRDHFIAQSLGGASDDYNLNYVPSEVNQAWGRIETKNLNSYKRGEISLPQARLNVLKEKQEWLLKQKGISQSVKDNLVYVAKDPINPVNTLKAVLKRVTNPLSLVKEYAKAILPNKVAELEAQAQQAKKPDISSMRFEVGAGMSNVEKVLPGPRLSTLEAVKQGAKIQPVQQGEAPQVSPVRQAQEVVRKQDVPTEKVSAFDRLLGGVSTAVGAVRASSAVASLPGSLAINALSGEQRLPARDIIEATSKMIEDEFREGGRASTAKGAQLYLANRGIGKYGEEKANAGDIAVLALMGLGDVMGDPAFYYGAVKPALDKLKFGLQYKKVGQVALKAKPGVKVLNPQKSIIDISDDLKIIVDPKSNGVTLKGYAKRGSTGEILNQKSIAGVVDDISKQSGLQMSGKVVGNDIIISTSKQASLIAPTTIPTTAKVVSAGKVALPKAQIKPQEARGDVLPAKTTKVSPEAKPSVVEPLEQEAKKYKTADEFIKAQGTPVYHGTNEIFDKFDFSKSRFKGEQGENLWGFGVYTSPNIGTAKNYGKNVLEIPFTAKKPLELSKFKSTKELADYLDMSEDALMMRNGTPTAKGQQAVQLSSKAKELGHDSIIAGQEIVILDPSQVKTKSQLTEIWNKANKKLKK